MTQRQLKFRAWDTVTQKFIESGFHFFGEVAAFEIVENYVRENNPNNTDFLLRLNDVIVQQWTGLTDNAGNDIYEGDILHFKVKDEEFKASVQWGEFGWSAKTCAGFNALIWFHFYDNCEIVANIFENPELLSPPV